MIEELKEKLKSWDRTFEKFIRRPLKSLAGTTDTIQQAEKRSFIVDEATSKEEL